jgi:hypothetical protein
VAGPGKADNTCVSCILLPELLVALQECVQYVHTTQTGDSATSLVHVLM